MGIGSSMGAFHEDEFRFEAAQWFIDPKEIDDNIVNPDAPNKGEFSDNTERFIQDKNIVTPFQQNLNKKLDDVELNPATGMGIEVGMKSQMPFPDNRNKEQEFDARFGNLPPSGIMNDLKKNKGETVPLVRKISDITTSTGVTITDEDVNKAIDIGSAFSGGRLTSVEKKAAETIKAAALKFEDKILEGKNHIEAYDKFLKNHPEGDYNKIVDGFTTSKGRFVSREEAMKIAIEADQLSDKFKKSQAPYPWMLLSEDLM